MKTRHNVTVSADLDEIIREEAKLNEKSNAQVIRDALLDYFKEQLKKRRVQRAK